MDKLSIAFAKYEPNYVLGQQYDAEEVIVAVFKSYRSSSENQDFLYGERIRSEFMKHEMKILETLSCMVCMDEGFTHLRERPMITVDYVHVTMDRNISNLVAGHSTFREGACENCNFRAGFYGYNNFPVFPRKLSSTAHTRIPISGNQSLQFRIGRGDSASWKVTADVLVLDGVRFKLKSWIEHFSLDGIESGHYISYKQDCLRTFKMNDSLVNEVSHGIIANSKVVFAVFLRVPSSLVQNHEIDNESLTPSACMLQSYHKTHDLHKLVQRTPLSLLTNRKAGP